MPLLNYIKWHIGKTNDWTGVLGEADVPIHRSRCDSLRMIFFKRKLGKFHASGDAKLVENAGQVIFHRSLADG